MSNPLRIRFSPHLHLFHSLPPPSPPTHLSPNFVNPNFPTLESSHFANPSFPPSSFPIEASPSSPSLTAPPTKSIPLPHHPMMIIIAKAHTHYPCVRIDSTIPWPSKLSISLALASLHVPEEPTCIEFDALL